LNILSGNGNPLPPFNNSNGVSTDFVYVNFAYANILFLPAAGKRRLRNFLSAVWKKLKNPYNGLQMMRKIFAYYYRKGKA